MASTVSFPSPFEKVHRTDTVSFRLVSKGLVERKKKDLPGGMRWKRGPPSPTSQHIWMHGWKDGCQTHGTANNWTRRKAVPKKTTRERCPQWASGLVPDRPCCEACAQPKRLPSHQTRPQGQDVRKVPPVPNQICATGKLHGSTPIEHCCDGTALDSLGNVNEGQT